MTIDDVAGNMKSCDEAGYDNAHDEETGEVHFVQVLWIEKEIRDTQVFAEASGDHGKQNHPAKQEYDVSPYVIQE